MLTTVGETTLSLGEWAVSAEPGAVLACLGLGSCVAFAAYDPVKRVGGMAHMVLPDSSMGRVTELAPAKFVDVAIPLILGEMTTLGALRSRLQVHLIGGARMLSGNADRMKIGERNAQAAQEFSRRLGLRVVTEELGGASGRTVRLHITTGQIRIHGAGSAASTLAA